MTPWAIAHPDLVARFNRALGDASAWAAKNPQQCVQILAKTFKLDPASISQSGLPTFPQRITPAMIAPEVTITARYGKFPAFAPADLIYIPR